MEINQITFFPNNLIFASQKLGQNHSRLAFPAFLHDHDMRRGDISLKHETRKERRNFFFIPPASTSFIHVTKLYLPNKSPLNILQTYVG